MKNYIDLLEIFDSTSLSVLDVYKKPGSLYITKNDDNPALLFGGTWELNESHLFLGWKIYERLSEGV